jgi:hypothetical protein
MDNTPSKVAVYNINGQLIHTYFNTKEIPFTDLSSGEYLVSIYDGKSSITKKIIKK